MPSCSPPARLERARPLLGTRVAVSVGGLASAAAHRAIDAAFGEVARIHALMSFHDSASELSRLNRSAAEGPVAVDPLTFETIDKALRLAAASDGAFDPTVGAAVIRTGALPEPARAPRADPAADWRDVQLHPAAGTVSFTRPLRLDLCGIAKGFAVDRAVSALQEAGAVIGLVNAGGDLRVFGAPERIALRTGAELDDVAPLLELADGAAASSGDLGAAGEDPPMAVHLAGARRRRRRGRFACVAAPECVWADGLTKVVLARGARSAATLRAFGARAYVLGPDHGWRSYGAAA
jgi:thiamine biosynthesis lipoprotein